MKGFMSLYSKNITTNKLYFIQSASISKFSRERLEEKKRIKQSNIQNKIKEDESKNAMALKESISIELKKKAKISPLDVFEQISKVELDQKIKENNSINMVVQLLLKKDQNIRGIRKCPGGSTKIPKVCVFTSSTFEDIALKSGADKVATPETYEEIKNKKIDYDIYICTMDVMNQVKLLGRILGPIGLMPNPKLGTAVTPDKLQQSIEAFKGGNKEFKSNKDGYVYLTIGKYHFGEINLLRNLNAFLTELDAKKPEGSKVKFIKNAWMSLGGLKRSFSIDVNTLDVKSQNYFGNKIKDKIESKI